MSQERIDLTIKTIIAKQVDSRTKTILTSLTLFIIGIALIYCSVLITLLSLVNPCIIIILLAFLRGYFLWATLLVKKRTLKRLRKSVRQFLTE